MFEWLNRWEIRQRQKAVQRHLGFLFERFGGGVCRIGDGNATEIWIEFGKVALHYWSHMSESGVVVGPVHDRTKRHELSGVLRFLAGEVEFPPADPGTESACGEVVSTCGGTEPAVQPGRVSDISRSDGALLSPGANGVFGWLKQRSIRRRAAVILRHLGFLIHNHGGVVRVISDAQFCIEFGNVALDHHRCFTGETESFLAPDYDQVKRHRLDDILRFLPVPLSKFDGFRSRCTPVAQRLLRSSRIGASEPFAIEVPPQG